MKSREQAAEYVKAQLERELWKYRCTTSGRNKGTQHHYGKQELRELMDFIYEDDKPFKCEEIK